MNIIEFLSGKLFLSPDDVKFFIQKAPFRYKVYSIPKRNGRGSRVIAQPASDLKFVQRLILSNILNSLPVHSVARAYRSGFGILDNVKEHVGSRYLLKMDFSDFFPSINPGHLKLHLERWIPSVDEQDFYCLERLLFWKPSTRGPCLSIGAPSSPFLSNSILYDFDSVLYHWCVSNGVKYTRYADDLTFTTNEKEVLFSVPDVVKSMLVSVNLHDIGVNDEKTVFSSKKHNRHVTGLVLTNDNKVSLGRDKKREIKTLIFLFAKGALDVEKSEFLKGTLAYVAYVEPEFLVSLERKFGTILMRGLVGRVNRLG